MKLEVGKTYKLVNDKDAIAKVIAEVSGEYSPKRYWVEISNYRKTHAQFVTQSLGDGTNVSYYMAYDLMEIPTEPRKKEVWVYLLTSFGGDIYTTSRNKKYDLDSFAGEAIGCKKITIVEGEFDE